ncbi:acyl-CoA dehydrogenase [Amycolatopsis sp. OK19-0408]|uniref:Acyl-CoA dehydrogenase n=1 Tax=Amycolatopsis iheyensis TaxID=2945988 RepID=A0A9X2SIZ8_9PSEU|nr:acyl-CoA dehydrogenase [Amycolatopsis iheyensis]MCR6483488.1 acyl-CoA dehydrogenase [Amycolatopsis iheyensis]
MEKVISVPSEEGLLERTAALSDQLADLRDWSKENRRLHEDAVEALTRAGILHMRRPARLGGYESSTRTMIEVLSILAGVDGSVAWNASAWTIGAWMTGMFPDHVQDEVFADERSRVCVVLSPTATATETEDGLVVDGRWAFLSGALHSSWQVILTMAPAPDGSLWPVAGLVPMSELEIVDDWHTSGLVGTGSVTSVAHGVHVPWERTLPMAAIMGNQYRSEANRESPLFNQPMLPTGASGFIGVVLGLARAAQADFFARLPKRKITFTDYSAQAEAPITHFQVAEALLKLEEAEYHAYKMADMLDGKGAAGEPWKLEDRVRYRGSFGRMAQLAKESVDILSAASGGSSIYTNVAIQRIHHDLDALSKHALMHPNTNFELFGRVMCGLEPNTMYL